MPNLITSVIIVTMGTIASLVPSDRGLASAILIFSVRLINELEKHNSVVSSPLSAEFVFALLALGTTDPGHTEVLTALGFKDDKELRSSFSTLSSKLKSVRGVTLNIANKLYLRQGLELNQQMQQDVKVFDTDVEGMNFGSGGAVDKINRWAESKTNNKIKNIVNPGSVNSSTQMVILNAIYFKGTWKKQFNPENTADGEFHVDSKSTITVPMMTLPEDHHRYGESENLQAELLVLPYVGNKASMLFVLPYEIDGLNGLLEKLSNGYDLIKEVDALQSKSLEVTIPKFTVETEISLDEVLPKLGIRSIFKSGVDNMLSDGGTVPVSKAIQKAFIEVNEEGTEAAAVTGGAIALSLPVHFIADQPFLYIITGPGYTTLFVGTYRG